MDDTNDTYETYDTHETNDPDSAEDMDVTRPLSSGSEEPERRSHPLSVGHLVCGLVFLGIAASWGLRQLDVIDSAGEQWVLPLVLVVAGGAGLLALVAKQMVGPKA